MLLMLAMGMALGAMMGAFITYLKVQPFIATLAGMWIARGMCFFISDDAIAINNRVYPHPRTDQNLDPRVKRSGRRSREPSSPSWSCSRSWSWRPRSISPTTRGLAARSYAIGGKRRNEQSARLMGLPVNSTKMLVYTLNGFCSALAGLILAIYVSSGHGLYATRLRVDHHRLGGHRWDDVDRRLGVLFGTLFGVLITAITQTLIQFNGITQLLVDQHRRRFADAGLHRGAEPPDRREGRPGLGRQSRRAGCRGRAASRRWRGAGCVEADQGPPRADRVGRPGGSRGDRAGRADDQRRAERRRRPRH